MQTEQIEDVKVIKPARKTRAEIMRDKVKIRLAPDTSGVLIQKILKDNDIELPVDWTKGIYPYWLLATVEEDVVGCIQVIPAKPMGMIEFLYVSPSAPFKIRAIAAQKLVIQATSTLYHNGSEYAVSTVDAMNGKFYDIIQKYAVKIAEATIFLKRLKNG